MTTLATLRAALANPNAAAFLHAIRLGEGTADALGYHRIVGGGTFTDESRHPRVKVWLSKYGVYSTAAGAYQIIFPTWQGLCQQYGFTDFSPESQDLAALALLVECRALDDAMAGRLDVAVKKASKEWASLPGSNAGQRVEAFANVQAAYVAAGGVVA